MKLMRLPHVDPIVRPASVVSRSSDTEVGSWPRRQVRRCAQTTVYPRLGREDTDARLHADGDR